MLQINYHKGVFEIKGKLESENSKSITSYFNSLFKVSPKIIISLKELKKIDSSGIQSLIELHNYSMRNNKVFHIIGKTNEKIRKKISHSKLNYIIE